MNRYTKYLDKHLTETLNPQAAGLYGGPMSNKFGITGFADVQLNTVKNKNQSQDILNSHTEYNNGLSSIVNSLGGILQGLSNKMYKQNERVYVDKNVMYAYVTEYLKTYSMSPFLIEDFTTMDIPKSSEYSPLICVPLFLIGFQEHGFNYGKEAADDISESYLSDIAVMVHAKFSNVQDLYIANKNESENFTIIIKDRNEGWNAGINEGYRKLGDYIRYYESDKKQEKHNRKKIKV